MATLSIYSLPDFLIPKLNTDKISVEENNGIFILKPARKKTSDFSSLRGMLADGKSSVEKHLQRMRDDLEIELRIKG